MIEGIVFGLGIEGVASDLGFPSSADMLIGILEIE